MIKQYCTADKAKFEEKDKNNKFIEVGFDEPRVRINYQTIIVKIKEEPLKDKTIGELLLEKKAELQIIRQHILNAQADEELDALPNLRIQRDTLKTEILSLEADIE